MGFDLTHTKTGSTFHFSGSGWTFILNLANRYGWKGMGTARPRKWGLFKQWPGWYDSNDGQFVKTEDAAHLADTLEKARLDPNLDGQAEQVFKDIKTMLEQTLGQPIPLDTSIAMDKQHLADFIRFCREGEFRID
jgi:hypothetical protein